MSERLTEEKMRVTPGPWRALPTPAKSYDDHGWRALATIWGGKWIVAVPKELAPRLRADAEGNARVLALAPQLFDAAYRITHAEGPGIFRRAFDDLVELVHTVKP